MADYTLTYSESSKGFPSFYSYYPEWMIGMNNYFYTFKAGNLYRHNTNETRNNYYGVQGSSIITTVLNKQPLETKLFKTFSLEGDDAWSATIQTDINQFGEIDNLQFEKKEGNYFAYIRNLGVSSTLTILSEADYKSRTIFGFGATISGSTNYVDIDGPIPSKASVYDYLFSENLGTGLISVVGRIGSISYNSTLDRTTITFTLSATGTPPAIGQFLYCVKDSAAESSGVSGHYAKVTLELPSTVTEPSELFALGSEVMKSYP